MADIQAMRAQMLRCFRELGSLQQNNRFLRSCISEGMIPKGLRVNFNLAKFVNDENLINNLQDIIDDANSRLLDLVYDKNLCRCSECQRLKDQEDKWIYRLGSFNPPAGLNTRNEIKSRVRVNFRDSGRI